MDKYSENIFQDRGTSHIYLETVYHNKIKYSANDLTVHLKNMLSEVKNMFIKIHCLV